MRMCCLLPFALAAVVGLAMLPGQASAQEAAASASCDAARGVLVIRYSPDVAETQATWPASPPPVRFMALLVLDEAQSTVEDTTSESFTCQLAKDRLEVTLEPGVPNPNLLGRCGAAVTGLVTVVRNGVKVLDEQEFEAINCHERENYIDTITFEDGVAQPAIHHASYPEA